MNGDEWLKDRINYGDIVFTAQLAEGVIEDALSDLIPDGPDKIGFDYYDGSIEIMVNYETPVDTEKVTALMATFGIKHGWINFSDETEIHFPGGERKVVSYPRWTKERREKFLHGS